MEKRVIPLTPPGPLWSQREYVKAMQLGIEFAAHRANSIDQWFHYAFPDEIGCTSVLVSPTQVLRYVDHEFPKQVDWLSVARAAVAKESK